MAQMQQASGVQRAGTVTSAASAVEGASGSATAMGAGTGTAKDPFVVLRCPVCGKRALQQDQRFGGPPRAWQGKVLDEALPGSTVRRPCQPCRSWIVFTVAADGAVAHQVVATPKRWTK